MSITTRRRTAPGLAVPRPTRMVDGLLARRRPVPLDPGTVRVVLAAYGLATTGPLAVLPLGQRSDLVVAPTAAGRVVVKRYPAHVVEDEIRHEHAIAGRLAAVGFPIAPLHANRRGTTMTKLAGDRYAVTSLVDGVSVAGCYLTRRARREIFRDAGAVLARFHDALEGFRPEGRHHLETVGADGRWDGGADQYRVILDTLAATAARAPADEHERWLLERRTEIGDAIQRLDAVLDGRRLDLGVIHGDFGIHNLTYATDGRATVHDLELARRDLLLIDVAVVLSCSQVGTGRAFLEGYASARPLDAERWTVLAEVWEHYRWCGAVRSWNNYRRLGDARRLTAARQRVEEARQLASEGLAAWE